MLAISYSRMLVGNKIITEKAWYVGCDATEFRVLSCDTDVTINFVHLDSDELDYVRCNFQNLLLPTGNNKTVRLFGDIARTVISNL